jgi:hypothetical protein
MCAVNGCRCGGVVVGGNFVVLEYVEVRMRQVVLSSEGKAVV